MFDTVHKSLRAIKIHVIFDIATGVVPSRSGNFNPKSDTHYEFAKVRMHDVLPYINIVFFMALLFFSRVKSLDMITQYQVRVKTFNQQTAHLRYNTQQFPRLNYT